MKKLLLLLFLIPNLVMAGECYVNTEVEEKFFGMKYTSEINKKIDAKKCKNKDILYTSYTFAEVNPKAVAASIFKVMARNCNIGKSIEYDLLTGHLVCEFKRNFK
jgi:hypothetical protein